VATNEEVIWSFLYDKIGNAYGVAGLMGNLYAESALKPTNLQNNFETKLGYSDASYTAAVDNGVYKNFTMDGAGYGLAQWTYRTRKAALLAYTQAQGKSIGDLDTQLAFLWKELHENFATVVKTLKSAKSVKEASNAVLLKFEAPKDQSEKVQALRASYGQAYYDKYAIAPMSEEEKIMADLGIINMPAHSTNQWYRNGNKIQYIVMHYVGAVSTAKNNGSYYGNTANIGASAHYFVDENHIVASVPEIMSAGHCGVDYSGGKAPFWGKCTNKNSIGIEMCCKKTASGQWYIEPATVTKSVALVKWLMAKYGIDAAHVVRHYDVCYKRCPEPWVRDAAQWADFKRRISEEEIDMTKAEVKDMVKEIVTEMLTGANTEPSDWAKKEMGEHLEDVKHITDGTRPRGYTKREETAAMVRRAEKRLMAKIEELK